MAMRQTIAAVAKEISTTSTGDYDPARVIGYGVLGLGSLVFLGLTIADTVMNRKFNYEGFTMAFLSIAAAIPAAAAGVSIKKSTERPFEEIEKAKYGVRDGATETATKETPVG